MPEVAGVVRLDGTPPGDDDAGAAVGTSEGRAWGYHRTVEGVWAWRKMSGGSRDTGPPLVRGNGDTLIADARIDAGFPPASDSDPSEDSAAARIARALDRWGAEAVDHLVGDFAFAALRDGRLILGRDEMSMRPLYFSRGNDGVLRFASSMGVLRSALGRPGPVDASAVAAFLTGARLPPGRSFFEDVLRVPPGSCVVISGNGEIDVIPRRPRSATPRPTNEEEAVDELWSLLRTAVRDRVPEGPAGLMLSGGADSAAVCLALAALGPDVRSRCTAYTWTFDQLPDADESPGARRVADLAGIRLQTVPGDDAWPLRDPEASVPDEDSPFVWPFRILTDHTLDVARTGGASVVLTGDRGDYVVGDWVYGDGRTLEPAPVPRYLTRPLAEEARRLHAEAGPMIDHPDGALRRQRMLDWGGAQIAEMSARSFRRAEVEYADPWSDRRIQDFVSSLPPDWVNRRGEPKRLLRRLLERLGLSAPGSQDQLALFERGLRDREAGRVRALWNDSLAGRYGFVDPAAVRKAVDRYVSGRPLDFDLWKPIALELWLRRLNGAPLP